MLLQRLPLTSDLCVIGGGASGFYAAIAYAEEALSHGRRPEVLILEKSEKLLHKVSISGGGRCNVLHKACVLPKKSYPRGAKLMEYLARRHGPADSYRWFQSKGIELKTEADGRVFPASNTSKSIVDCFVSTADSLGVRVLLNAQVTSIERTAEEMFSISAGGKLRCKRLIVCTGSAQKRSAQALLQSAGANLQPVAPSLFSLLFAPSSAQRFHALEGVAVPDAHVEIEDDPDVHARGPLLITHGGISGPAILRLSAWGAYVFHKKMQQTLRINWAPHLTASDMARCIMEVPNGRREQPPVRRKALGDVSPWPSVLPARLWARLLRHADEQSHLASEFSDLSTYDSLKESVHLKSFSKLRETPLAQWPWRLFMKSAAAEALAAAMFPWVTRDRVEVAGRRVNKEEFVTAGGVDLKDLDWDTMESRSFPGVHFAGEALDVDGITGGFNFQNCWSSGYVAGVQAAKAMASKRSLRES